MLLRSPRELRAAAASGRHRRHAISAAARFSALGERGAGKRFCGKAEMPEASSRRRVPILPEGRCPCRLRPTPRQRAAFEKGFPCTPAQTLVTIRVDGDGVFDTAPAAEIIVTTVTHRHALSGSYRKVILRPSCVRLFQYRMSYSRYKRPVFTFSFMVSAFAFMSTASASVNSVGLPVHSGLSAFTRDATASRTASGGALHSSVSHRSNSQHSLFSFRQR